MNPASWFAVASFIAVVVWLVIEAIRAPHKANEHADDWYRED